MNGKAVKIGNIIVGKGNPIVFIGGPCVIESRESAMEHARAMKEITDEVGVPFIFKSSYDKANRSSINSFRGPGITEGLKILKELGLHHRDASGKLISVDDPRLSAIWDEAGRLGVPVLIHQSDHVVCSTRLIPKMNITKPC